MLLPGPVGTTNVVWPTTGPRGWAPRCGPGWAALAGATPRRSLVTLVDLPDVGAEVVRRVVAAATGPATLARATYDGTPGAPGPDRPRPLGRRPRVGRAATRVLATTSPPTTSRSVECGDLATGRDVDRASLATNRRAA